jgi:fatty acid desaturase
MADLCKYKNALGEPGKGVHSYRLFGVAIADVVMTLIGAIILSYFFNWSFIYTAVCLFILGIILHRLFCVRTTVDKLLFS